VLQQPAGPIIIRVAEEPASEIAGLGDVFIRAVGLTGFIALVALVLGFGLAGLFIAYQKMKMRRTPDSEFEKTQPLGLAGK
jgi:Na+/H+-dicarboxylate symporter